MSGAWLLPLGAVAGRAGDARALAGAKAAGLARARRAGLPVLPGWVLPAAAAAAALAAGRAELQAGRPAAARRAVLGHPLGPGLADALRDAVAGLGGTAIIRSSSPLEADGRWAGAFTSVTGVRPEDAAAAVRSCWASAFAPDPLGRLAECGLGPADLGLGVVVQPEIRPDAGGVARVLDGEVVIEGVAGHPAALLGGWAEGAAERRPLAAGRARAAGRPGGALAQLIGPDLVAAVAALARDCHRELGDDLIEWAACGRQAWLLQSRQATGPEGAGPGRPGDARGARSGPEGSPAGPALAGPLLAERFLAEAFLAEAFLAEPFLAEPFLAEPLLAALAATAGPAGPAARVRWMPVIATIVSARGRHVAASPAAPGVAAGRLVPARPHRPAAAAHAGAVLLVDRPVPALAPLLFAACGVIARRGGPGSHLADVARSLGVPMVTGCPLDPLDLGGALDLGDVADLAGPAGAGAGGGGPVASGGTAGGGPRAGASWLAAVDGTSGDVALLPGSDVALLPGSAAPLPG